MKRGFRLVRPPANQMEETAIEKSRKDSEKSLSDEDSFGTEDEEFEKLVEKALSYAFDGPIDDKTDGISNGRQTHTFRHILNEDIETQTTNSWPKDDIKDMADRQTQTDPIVTQKDSNEPILEWDNKYYICVFCKLMTYFLNKDQAVAHYKSHLGGAVQCCICYSSYDTVEEFQSADQHLDIEENNNRIKQFYLTLDWIDSFLDFQMTRPFIRLLRMPKELCPVCVAIKQLSGQTLIALSAIENEDTFEEHIRNHLKYIKVYECIQCNEESDGKKFGFFYDLSDATTHLKTHDKTIDSTEILIENHFRLNSNENNVCEKFIQKYIDLNKSLKHVFEEYSIDSEQCL